MNAYVVPAGSIWPWLDVVAAAVLLGLSMANINHMRRGSKHCFRFLNIGIAVAALGVMLTAWQGGEVRYIAHVVLTVAFAAQAIIGRRRTDRLQADA